MTRWLQPHEQPTLEEMLDEPIVQLLMARDGVARAEIETLVERLRLLQAPCRPFGLPAGRGALPEAVPLPVARPRRHP